MTSKSKQLKRLWSLALLLVLMCLPQTMWAETGVWTRSVGTRFGKCSVNNNTVISYNGLNSTSAWGDNSVQDKDDLGTPNCKGTQFTGKTDSKDEKLMTISIFQQQYTIPAYTKIVRTSNFKTVMATGRYKHGAGLYLFDDYATASTATLDVMPDQNQATSQGDCVIKATDTDGSHTWHNADRTFTFDNSTSATAATIIKYAAFAHVTCAYSNTDKTGLEWAGFREDFTDTYIYCATVSYNSNGGSGSMSSTSITGSGSLSSCAFTSPNPGYKYFKCWNTRSDGTGTSYAANETFSASESVKGPVTLYAIWGDCNYDSDGIFTSTSGEQYYQPATKNSSGVYEITNKGKMMWFSQNAGSLYDQSFALTTDIDMSGLPYISPFYATSYDNLSYNKSTITQAGFKGIFDGKGHTISNMSVPYADGRFSAGIVGNNSGTIKNVIMDNFSYDNGGSFDGRYGAICGVNFGTVENCGVVNSLVAVDGKICGAVVGANYGGTINNSFAKGCTVTANDRVGYLVGDNCNDDSSLKGKIVNCYVDGNRLQGTQCGASCTGDSIISADRFKSGEICYKLNGKVNGGTTWYQVINSDEYPKLLKSGTTNTVYYGYEHCGSTSADYSNSSRYTERPNHGSISVSGSYYTATYSNWSGTWDAPTCNFSLKCTKCSQQVLTNAELTPSTTYAYGSLTQTAKVDAKCQATGSRTLKAKGQYPATTGYNSYTEASDKYTKTYTIPSLGHGTTGYTESYSWSGTCYNDATKDTESCKFTLTCKTCSLNVVSGQYLTPTLKAHTDAGCLTTGSTTYEVTGTYTATGSQSYSATKTYDYTVAALGHGSTGYTETYSWTGTCYNDATQDNPACTFTLTCKKCSEDVVSEESLTPTLKWHTDAGCLTTGNTTYQATGTYSATGSKDYSNTKTHEYTVAALGHNYVFTDGDNGFEHCKNQCGQLSYQPAEVVACDQDGHPTYSIGNAGQLYWFADKVNNDNNNYKSANARLTKDIVVNEGTFDANGKWSETGTPRNWTPIAKGYVMSNDTWYEFCGTFDGDGHTISGLYFNNSSTYYVGLFGYAYEATINNVGVVNAYFKGCYEVGGVCGDNNNSTISNCYATGTVSGTDNVGGVCGYNFYSTITNCYATGTVSGTGECVGGVCGFNKENSTISNCYATGEVSGSSNVGGVCGYNNYSTISNCYATATVSGTDKVGGVCGYNFYSTITNCYTTAAVSGDYNVGGVCGFNKENSTISNCYATGTVSGTGNNVGGVCGNNSWSIISNCYATGTVSGNRAVGGVCGMNVQGSTIENCYTTQATTVGESEEDCTIFEVKSDVTLKRFQSGEIAWKLNGSIVDGTWTAGPTTGSQAWYQNLSANGDDSPRLSGNTVYYDSERTPAYYNLAIVPGDLNADGNITIADLTRLVEILNNRATDTNGTADVDGNGNITTDDANALRNKILEVK